MKSRYRAARHRVQWMFRPALLAPALLLLALLAHAQSPRVAAPGATAPRTVLVMGDSLSAA